MCEPQTSVPMEGMKAPRSLTGFSVLELLVAIAIVGILASLAFPFLRDTLITQEVKSTSFDLMAALTVARSEAIKRNATVRIAANNAADWGQGWQVSVTSGPSNGTVLRNQPAAKRAAISVTPGGTGSITFSSTGRPTSGPDVTLQVKDATGGTSIKPRCITLTLTGLPDTRIGACS
jgi:type IV fimbrial biogenesis protein FimT